MVSHPNLFTWQRWSNAPRTVLQSAWERTIAHYQEPTRFYHTLTHIQQLLTILEPLEAQMQQPAAIYWATWFHDVIYDARLPDNEERSAAYAERNLRLFALPVPLITRVTQLILATQYHASPHIEDPDAAIFLDADFAILGAEPTVYQMYTIAIRQEYAWVPDDDYRRGRRRLLETWLGRDRLYRTPFFAHLEAPARANLQEEVRLLGTEGRD